MRECVNTIVSRSQHPQLYAIYLSAMPLQELQRQQAATNGKADDFRLKLKECRATLSVKEKQLETAQRLLDRLGIEKQEMQVSRVAPLCNHRVEISAT